MIAGAATALILGLGSWRVIHGDFTLGGLVAFQGYLLLMLAAHAVPGLCRADLTAGGDVG